MSLATARLIAAPYTPFHDDGQLDLDRIERLAAALIEANVAGVFVGGTTGEGLSLTTDERMKLAERWLACSQGRLEVTVHIGQLTLGDTRALAEHAKRIKVAAISAIPPCYYRPAGVAELVGWCREATAPAAGVPFFYYHIPSMTNVDFRMADLLAQAGPWKDLAGVKFSHHDLLDFGRCAELEQGRFTMLLGCDELLLAGLLYGAKGAVGSTYNLMPEVYGRLMRHLADGNLAAAQREQAAANRVNDLLNRFAPSGVATGKAVMRILGLDCGPVRPPLRSLSSSETRRLEVELGKVGFFEIRSRGPR